MKLVKSRQRMHLLYLESKQNKYIKLDIFSWEFHTKKKISSKASLFLCGILTRTIPFIPMLRDIGLSICNLIVKQT